MSAVLEDKDVYLSSYAKFEKDLKTGSAEWLNRIRQSAIDRFAALCFPTLDDEEWRFTNLAPLTKVPFTRIEYADQDPGDFGLLPPGGLRGTRLLFPLGLRPQLYHEGPALPNGVIVCDL